MAANSAAKLWKLLSAGRGYQLKTEKAADRKIGGLFCFIRNWGCELNQSDERGTIYSARVKTLTTSSGRHSWRELHIGAVTSKINECCCGRQDSKYSP